MKYMAKHRDVEFLVFYVGGEWKYTVGKETRVPYSEPAHAICAAIKHIDEMLFRVPRASR
jgi:hypothetical protein